jgi:hypothetical protein
LIQELIANIRNDDLLRNFSLSALNTLLDKSLHLASGQGDNPFELFRPISTEQGRRYCALLASYSKTILPVLFSVYESINLDMRPPLLQTIRAYIEITNHALVHMHFKKTIKRLLETTVNAASSVKLKDESHSTMKLALIMVPYLNFEALQLLYRVIKPIKH